jgi:hypothetical protein
MAALLGDVGLTLVGCRLVTLRVRAIRAHRDTRTGEARASLTVEAITETL